MSVPLKQLFYTVLPYWAARKFWIRLVMCTKEKTFLGAAVGSIVDLGKERRSRSRETVCDKRQDAVAQCLPLPQGKENPAKFLVVPSTLSVLCHCGADCLFLVGGQHWYSGGYLTSPV